MPRTMVYGRGGRTGPKPLEAAFQGLASGLAGAAKGYTDIQKGRMNQLTAAFPSLVAAGLMKQSPTGDIRFGGQRWEMQEPTPDYTKMLAGVRYGQATGAIKPSPQDIATLSSSTVGRLMNNLQFQIELANAAAKSKDQNFAFNFMTGLLNASNSYWDAYFGGKPDTTPPTSGEGEGALKKPAQVSQELWDGANEETRKVIVEHYKGKK